MMYDTVAEYDTAIEQTQAAIARQLQIGAEHSNNSGGSSRSTREIDLTQLRNHLSSLKRERALLNGDRSGGIVFGEAW